MALAHFASGNVIHLRQEGEDLSRFSSTALAKTAEIELIRMALPRGKGMPEHSVTGAVTLLCLEGEIAVQAHGRTEVLGVGDLMYLNGGQVHALQAQRDALLLLTIVLEPRPSEGD